MATFSALSFTVTLAVQGSGALEVRAWTEGLGRQRNRFRPNGHTSWQLLHELAVRVWEDMVTFWDWTGLTDGSVLPLPELAERT